MISESTEFRLRPPSHRSPFWGIATETLVIFFQIWSDARETVSDRYLPIAKGLFPMATYCSG